jgi:radical SAM protein with 4Fe4S-binding SPASM domain
LIETPKGSSSPAVCFWEITQGCDHCCVHCRASAGEPAEDELSGEQALLVANQIVDLGVRRVVLTGGEPLTRPDWADITRRLNGGGVKVRLFTNGDHLDGSTLDKAVAAGVSEIAVSLDGMQSVHDDLRPVRDSSAESPFETASAAIGRAVGEPTVNVRVVTQVNRFNLGELERLAEEVEKLGADVWQVHLCQATGRASGDLEELILQPGDLERVVGVLYKTAQRGSVQVPFHCTIGYMTPEEIFLKRGLRPWNGCQAGLRMFSITANGSVKGCTTLPDEFIAANVGTRTLAEIWADDSSFPFTRKWSPEVLDGACARCDVALKCRAGCPAMAYGVTGTIGANPFCLRTVRGHHSG